MKNFLRAAALAFVVLALCGCGGKDGCADNGMDGSPGSADAAMSRPADGVEPDGGGAVIEDWEEG